MFRHTLSFLTFLAGLQGYTQNQSLLDSLLNEVKNARNDSIRVSYHYELCYQWAEYNFDSSIYHAKKMREIAAQSNHPILLYQALSAKGLAHDYQYSFDSAIYYYKRAKEEALTHNYKKGLAVSTFNIGVVNYYSGAMEEAIENYQEAELIYLELDDQRNLSVLYNNMGLIYSHTKKYTLARDSYLNSLAIKRKRKDIIGVMNTLTNLSTVYQHLQEFEKAKEASEEVIALAKEHGNQGAYLSELINLGKIHMAMDQSAEAVVFFKEAETMLDENSPYTFKINIFHQLSNFYTEKKEFEIARKYLDLVQNNLTEDQLNIGMNHYLTLTKYYQLIGQKDKAFDALQQAFTIRESLFDNEVLEKTTELEQLYEKERREVEIARLNVENDLSILTIEKNRRERNALIVGSVLIVGLAVLFFVLFKQKKKSLSERETLLKEIHHRVKNNLQIISSLLNLQAGSLEDEAAIDAVKEGQNRVKSMALIHENLYQNDDLAGIAVDDYVENLMHALYSSFGVDSEKIKTKLYIEKIKLDIDTLIPLGLILNELMSNSLKYAFPNGEGQLSLSLNQGADGLDLLVKDNGPGFNEEKLETSNSYGWKMVKSLSRKLKADISIKNDQGTEISLKIRNYKLVA